MSHNHINVSSVKDIKKVYNLATIYEDDVWLSNGLYRMTHKTDSGRDIELVLYVADDESQPAVCTVEEYGTHVRVSW